MEVERKTSEERADALEEAMMKELDKPGVRRGTESRRIRSSDRVVICARTRHYRLCR